MSRHERKPDPVSRRFAAIATCALLLLSLSPAAARAAARELGLPLSARALQTDYREIEGKRFELPRGAFSFEPRAKVEGISARRTIVEAGGRFEPGAAWMEVAPSRNFVGMRSLEKKPVGRTALELLAVEILENGRTVALVETAALLNSGRNSRMWPFNLDVENWDAVEFLYHVRIVQEDPERPAIPELRDGGRATLRWKPSAFALSVEAARERGRPPRPGELRTLASGLVIYPSEPFVDDTFTATIVLQNVGDLPTTSRILCWAYGGETATTELPPLPSGATASLHFSAVAREDDDRVSLDLGDRLLLADFELLRRPILRLLSAVPAENYTEDPLVMQVSLANTGSGGALGASLAISTPRTETIVMLPNLAPRRSTTIPITWRHSFTEPETVTVELRDDNRSLGAITFRLARRYRPRPAFSILSVELEGERGAGNPCRVRARIRNHGDLAGSAAAELAVVHATGDRLLGSRIVTQDLASGEERDFHSEAFPQEPGLLKARVRLGNEEEFQLVDVPPPPAMVDETAVELFPELDSTDAPGFAVVPLTGAVVFRFSPVSSLEEIDSAVTLILRSTSWRNPSGAMEPAGRREPRAVIRVTVMADAPNPSGGAGDTASSTAAASVARGWRDKFEIASSETLFTYPLARHLLADTWTITLEPTPGATVFLVGAPRLLASLSANQNGWLESARATETGVYCLVLNRGTRIRSPFVTAAILEENGRAISAGARIAPGDRGIIFLPTSLATPGRHAVTVTLPLSPTPQARVVEQFIAPVPFPRLGFAGVVGGRSTRTGEAGMLALIPVTRSNAPDLRLRPLHGSRKIDTVTFNLVPASETVAIWAPGADGMLIDYGPIQEPARATAPPRAAAASRLRILDLGGETPTRRGDFVVRYVRSAIGETLPEARIWLAVNGLLRSAQTAPQLLPGERYFGAFRVSPSPTEDLGILIFERGETPSGPQFDETSYAIVDAISARLAAEGSAPTRGDRDWTRPVHFARPLPVSADPYLRASDAAWGAARFLMAEQLADLPPVTPEPVRELARWGSDTTAAGRINYREALSKLVEEWRNAGMMLSGARLPVTVEASDLAAFFTALDELDSMAGHPSPLDRRRVETTLNSLAASTERLLGLRVEITLP
jgi:hypothetical protein